MIDTVESLVIKSWLSTQPCVPLTTKPLFRLVWSDDQYELRKGTFGRFVQGIKVSEESRVESAPKYSWIKDRWILEQWFPPNVAYTEELPDSVNGSYEPIYVFESNDGEALPLNKLVIEFVVSRALKPKTSGMLKKSISDANLEEREKRAAKEDWEVLNDEGPLVSQFHDGSAILVPEIK